MRAYLPAYELKVPANLDHALQLIADQPGVWRPFAGGTDLMVLLEAGKLTHKRFLSLWGLQEFRGIITTDQFLTIGALTTYAEIQQHPIAREAFPMLCEAASLTGSVAIQNRGTLGGNIANASPAADSLPPLLVYEAHIELVSTRGARWVAYSDFHTGYKEMVMREDELIKSIRLPRATHGWRQTYRKVGTRKAQAISKVCFAGVARMSDHAIDEIRIALGSVAPTPIRAFQTEALLRGRIIDDETVREAKARLASEVSAIDDLRSTAEYRTRVAMNVLEEFLDSLRAGV